MVGLRVLVSWGDNFGLGRTFLGQQTFWGNHFPGYKGHNLDTLYSQETEQYNTGKKNPF